MKVQLTIMFLLLSFGFVAANHASLNLPEIVKQVNENAASVPDSVLSLFGNERINVYFEDGTIGIVTKKGKIIEYREQAITSPTLNVYVKSNTLKKLMAGQLEFTKAVKSGELRYEAIDPITKIKAIIADFAMNLFVALTEKN
ncbi:MAG: hypothetical protein Q8R15_02705 [Candidatus Micrarchaeota archaeon]|nr:hypothetical protein [Candidatus Micrarchaeota archaeon]